MRPARTTLPWQAPSAGVVLAGSTIGAAGGGTVVPITVAELSLAAGQMGPRLLSNSTRDRGNQITPVPFGAPAATR